MQAYLFADADGTLIAHVPAICPCCGAYGCVQFCRWRNRLIRLEAYQESLPPELRRVNYIRVAEMCCQACGGSFRVLPSFLVPFKHVASPVISQALHEASRQLRTLREIADVACVARQTVGTWLEQLASRTVAHVSEHIPEVVEGMAAAGNPAPQLSLKTLAVVERLMQLALAVASGMSENASSSAGLELKLERDWLGIIQPVLAGLASVAGVFRGKLCRRRRPRNSHFGRGPP